MTIRTILINELEEFVRSESYRQLDLIPITPERALSQVENPYSHPDEPALWIANDPDDKIVGFIGSLPAFDPHNRKRMGWNSCWWTDPVKGKGAAMQLFYHFLRHWDQQVAFSDMTLTTNGIVRQMDFCHTRELTITFGLLRFAAIDLLKKSSLIAHPIAAVAFIFSPVINLIQRIRISTAAKRTEVTMEIATELNTEMEDFITTHSGNDFSRRSGEDFRWIFSRSWLVPESEKSQIVAAKYPFSYTAREFRMFWLISKRKERITSLMLVSVREGSMKVLYYYGDHPGDGIHALIQYIAKNRKIRTLRYSHPELNKQADLAKRIFIVRRSQVRYVGVSKKILETFREDMVMQLGDGDAVFT